MPKEYHLHSGKRGAALAVHVVPRAQRNEIVEVSRDGSIKIRLNTTTDREEMNSKLVSYLAQVLRIEESKIDVVAGESGLSKLVSVLDMDVDVAHKRILTNLS